MAYLPRTLLYLLLILEITLTSPPQVKSAQAIAEADATEPLFYTIQVGSFGNEEEARTWYDRLAAELPADLKAFLRIETIPPFHTVRVGKADERQAITRLLEETQKITQKPPAVLHGDYKAERITKLYDPSAPPEAQKSPQSVLTEKKSPLPSAPEESLTTEPDAKATPLPPRPAEPIEGPPGNKDAAKTTRRSESAKVKGQQATPAQLPDSTMKQLIIDKYLADQAANAKNKEALIKLSQTYPETPACVTSECHGAINAVKNLHYPAQSGRCLACHKQTNQQHPDANGADFQLLAEGADLCNTCHPKLKGKKVSHAPAAKGECLQCHAPHGSDNQYFLSVGTDKQEKLCLTCHDRKITSSKFTHGPVGLGSCTFCHAPHESDYNALLKNDLQVLCLECHVDIAVGMKESASVHQVMQTEGCATCHLPHGSEFPSLLKQSGEALCFTCHPAIEEKSTKSRSKHAGLYLEKGCATCHSAHSSPYNKLLTNKELDLCLTCHSGKNTVTSKAPKDISLELKQTFLHEPLAQGQCAVCHDPHGSKFYKLLIAPYPDAIYATYEPEIYDLCFTCHDKELLTNQTTSSATSFRNGAQNLHYLHATIPRKGRTCRTCHQSHASNGPKLINQTGSSFGEWQMSISYATSSNGGSCMPGCHRKMEYNRDKEVSNAVKESEFGEYHVEYESVR